jgi:hypothetical protein
MKKTDVHEGDHLVHSRWNDYSTHRGQAHEVVVEGEPFKTGVTRWDNGKVLVPVHFVKDDKHGNVPTRELRGQWAPFAEETLRIEASRAAKRNIERIEADQRLAQITRLRPLFEATRLPWVERSIGRLERVEDKAVALAEAGFLVYVDPRATHNEGVYVLDQANLANAWAHKDQIAFDLEDAALLFEAYSQ